MGIARLAEKFYYWYIPDFGVVHPLRADQPEEEVILFSFASWISRMTGMQWHVPDFVEWVKTQDPRLAYVQLRRILQLLQWKCSGEKWVLKTPFHLSNLDTLVEI